MRTLPRLITAVVVLSSALPAQPPEKGQRTTLEDIARIAGERLAKQRPDQERALQPFLADLEQEYTYNRRALDKRFVEIAKLGDAIVPVLLDKLSPPEGDGYGRTVAANSARVLALIDPAGYVDALIGIAAKPGTGRIHAIHLLGRSRSRAAALALGRMFDHLKGHSLVATIRALQQLNSVEIAPKVVAQLGSENRSLREAALQYLAATRPPEVRDSVLAALARERFTRFVPIYVRYIEGTTRRDAATAKALLDTMDRLALGQYEQEMIIRALATVAPEGHQPSIAACLSELEKKRTDSLGRSCALTMNALGDDKGVDILLDNLKTEIKAQPRNKGSTAPFTNRGSLYLALERWAPAARDFEAAIARSNDRNEKLFLYLLVARCEAHLKRWRQVLDALRDSGAGHARIQAEMERDPALASAMRQQAIRRYVDELPRAK